MQNHRDSSLAEEPIVRFHGWHTTLFMPDSWIQNLRIASAFLIHTHGVDELLFELHQLWHANAMLLNNLLRPLLTCFNLLLPSGGNLRRPQWPRFPKIFDMCNCACCACMSKSRNPFPSHMLTSYSIIDHMQLRSFLCPFWFVKALSCNWESYGKALCPFAFGPCRRNGSVYLQKYV